MTSAADEASTAAEGLAASLPAAAEAEAEVGAAAEEGVSEAWRDGRATCRCRRSAGHHGGIEGTRDRGTEAADGITRASIALTNITGSGARPKRRSRDLKLSECPTVWRCHRF